jgi:predicted DNA-binding protein with PD1-like motif
MLSLLRNFSTRWPPSRFQELDETDPLALPGTFIAASLFTSCESRFCEAAMRSKLLHQSAGQRIYALVLETGDEAMACLQDFANKEKISAAQITGIGALSDATLNYFDWEQKKYLPIPVREQVEVASLIGDVALSPSGKPAIHLHAVLGRRDGTALAGHLAQAHVRPTLELILSEPPTYLQKVHDPQSGLALIRP